MDECKPLPRTTATSLAWRGSHTRAVLWRRKLNLKAKFESSISHFSFKRLVPGGFNLGFRGST